MAFKAFVPAHIHQHNRMDNSIQYTEEEITHKCSFQEDEWLET